VKISNIAIIEIIEKLKSWIVIIKKLNYQKSQKSRFRHITHKTIKHQLPPHLRNIYQGVPHSLDGTWVDYIRREIHRRDMSMRWDLGKRKTSRVEKCNNSWIRLHLGDQSHDQHHYYVTPTTHQGNLQHYDRQWLLSMVMGVRRLGSAWFASSIVNSLLIVKSRYFDFDDF